MAILKSSTYQIPCERCRRPFDPVEGGVCARCGMLLCGDHLHGSMWRRLRAVLGAKPVCIYCRKS
jgi:rRNA maturation endonuclease Nob1